MTQSKPIISLKNISKIFYSDAMATHALSKIEFDIMRGEFLSISGPSGVRKIYLAFYSWAVGCPK